MFRNFHANDPERRKWQNPEEILSKIGLNIGSTYIDLGCGAGFFTLPAARMVGKQGMVYGVDIDAECINELKNIAEAEGLLNINLTVGKAEEIIPCQTCADIVFLGTVLHDFDEPLKVLQNARRMLKAEGRLINLDWKKEKMKIGPPIQKRFSIEKASGLLESAGFFIEGIEDNGLYHYLIRARIKQLF